MIEQLLIADESLILDESEIPNVDHNVDHLVTEDDGPEALLFLDESLIPNVDHLITEDDTPVDNFASAKQQRLLTSTLYSTLADVIFLAEVMLPSTTPLKTHRSSPMSLSALMSKSQKIGEKNNIVAICSGILVNRPKLRSRLLLILSVMNLVKSSLFTRRCGSAITLFMILATKLAPKAYVFLNSADGATVRLAVIGLSR